MSKNQFLDLNRLIQERKGEKQDVLRQRLRQKLQLIREWGTVRGNVEPFPGGTFEKLQSNNVWTNVLDYVTEASDVSNLYFSCELFSEILVEKQKLVRLPETLRVLQKKVPSSTTEAICLNLRGISKEWKKVAEAHLFESSFSGESWYLDMDTNMRHDETSAIQIPRMCMFDTEESVDLAVASLSARDPSFNSSLIRKVCVDETKVPFLQTFHQKVIQCLGYHGESVWYLQFGQQHSYARQGAEVYSRLWEIVQLMPNLKALILHGVTDTRYDWEENLAFQNLRHRLNERPFPVLPSLQHLHCICVEDHVFLTQIFQSCVNLRSVIHSDIEIAPEEMATALKKLTLDRYEGYWKYNGELVQRLPPILAGLAAVDWPLKKLVMNLEGDFGTAAASHLFPALNKFQDTLQHLHLEVSGLGIKIDTDLRFELPHLRYLCMDRLGHARSRVGIWLGFDYLLSLKCLEKVVILKWVRDNWNAHVKVQRHLEWNSMDQSNVWGCFPNLLTIEHGRKIYKRPKQI